MPSLRSFLTAALLAFLAAPTAGQAQNLKLGLRAGVHLASLRGTRSALLLTSASGPEDQGDWGHRAVLQAGAVLQMEVSDWVVVQPELNYVQKGGTARASLVQDVEMDQTTRYSYLELPVLAKLRLPTGGRLEPSLLAGPFFGLNLRAKSVGVVRTRFPGAAGGSRTEEHTVSSTEFGAVLGGRVAYVFPSGNAFSIGVRYSRGFTDVGPEGAEGSVRTETIGLGIGYVVAL